MKLRNYTKNAVGSFMRDNQVDGSIVFNRILLTFFEAD
jgi:hypothetical protein